MKVIKVLNNSLVLVLDKSGYEKVLMGKGIGFKKVIGDIIDESEIEKEFFPKDNEFSTSIMRLAMEIDPLYFEISKKLIDLAESKYNIEVLDYLFLALTDHLSFAVKRKKENMIVPNLYNTTIREFYEQEYELGEFALKLVKEETGITLDDVDAITIAMHFVNARQPSELNNTLRTIDQLIKKILEIVKYTAGFQYDKESVAYGRFITHLTYFLKRVLSNDQVNPSDKLSIYTEMIQNYDLENRCVDAIERFLNTQTKIKIDEQERCYLIIHLNRIINESKLLA